MEMKGQEFDFSCMSGEQVAASERECATLSGLTGSRDRRPGAALVPARRDFALPPAMMWIAFGDHLKGGR